jgi:hypothetical protein
MAHVYVLEYVHVYAQAADLRRGDIKVHPGGTTWILDVGVVCPGTQRYVDQGSQATPGRAAEA